MGSSTDEVDFIFLLILIYIVVVVIVFVAVLIIFSLYSLCVACPLLCCSIVCSVSFDNGVLFCVMCVVSYCSTTATRQKLFVVKINNNNK
jgi:hypothetical protein